MHRFFALLGLGMLALHGVALVLDRTVHMPVAALFVPFLSHYRPARGRLRRAHRRAGRADHGLVLTPTAGSATRNWRRLHWATYLVFLMGTVHGLTAGTDASQPWAVGLYLGAVGAVAFATAWRVLTRPVRPTPALERSA